MINQLKFSGKNIIITGGCSGIGLATALRFANKGGSVFVLDRNIVEIDNKNIHVIKCDVTKYEEVQNAIKQIHNSGERCIHVLFACAGIHFVGNIEETPLEDIDNVINVNIKGTLFALKAVLPIMKAQKYGSIVLTGSDQSFIGKEKSAVYGLTKAAIAQLGKSTALDYAEFNIRVNCICPGTIDTPLLDGAVEKFGKSTNKDPKMFKTELAQAQPIKRLGKAEEIAKAVTYFCSDNSGFTTGATLSVDGGYTAK